MERRQRRAFTDDYKRQAVDLVASSGRSVGSIAKELGLRDSVLRRWVEQRGAGREPTAAARRPTTQATLIFAPPPKDRCCPAAVHTGPLTVKPWPIENEWDRTRSPACLRSRSRRS